jgi:chemotaxis protein MotB
MLFEECLSTLKPEGRELISNIGASLRPYRHFFSSVQIEGHTDRQRPLPACGVADNWALSSERATAVVRILADSSSFQDQTLLSAVGRGQFHPVGVVLPSDTTSESLARHRRIEVFLQYSDWDLRGAENR